MQRKISHFLLLWLLILLSSLATAAEEGEKQQAEYFKLAPSLVSNVQGKAKYMRCDIQLMTHDPEALADIERHAPALRHALLLLLGDQKGEELKAPGGKEKLRKEALKRVQKTMQELTGKEAVEDLFFTSYFVQ